VKGFDEKWLMDYQARIRQSKSESKVVLLSKIEKDAPKKKLSSNQKATNEELVSAWEETKNIRIIGEKFGMRPSSVHERLVKLTGGNLSYKPITEEEKNIIISKYCEYANSGRREKLAKQLGRHPLWLSRKAKEFGLTNYNRPHDWAKSDLENVESEFREIHTLFNDRELSDKFGVSLGTIVKWRKILGLKKPKEGRWSLSPHPRGATGLVISPEHREKLISGIKKAWNDPNHRLNSDEYKQICSNRMMNRKANKPEENPYSRCSGGKRSDLGNVYFRSSWEANYARYLNFLVKHNKISKWEYESDTFIFHEKKRGIRSYKPDFKIWENESSEPYFVEIKGWMDDKSKTKLKYMTKYYPEIKVIIVGESEYKSIRDSVRKMIPEWENVK